MSTINLTIPILQTHSVGILTIDPGMALPRAVAAKTDTVTVVNGVPDFTTPHAFLWIAGVLFGDSVVK